MKNILLETGLFAQNVWFDKYIELIELNKHTTKQSGVTNAHHIYPKSLNKYCYCIIFEEVVNLKYYEHIQAHCLLALCLKEKRYQHLMVCAVNCLTNKNYKLSEFDSKLLHSFKEYQYVYEMQQRLFKEFNPMKDSDVKTKHQEKMRSFEVRNAISTTMKNKAKKGELFSNTHRKKISESRKGKRYINNGMQEKYVLESDVEKFIQIGWKMGKLRNVMSEAHRNAIIKAHTGFVFSDASKKKMSLSHIGKAPSNKGVPLKEETKEKLSLYFTGTKWMNNGKIQKQIKPNEVEDYFEKGFIFGRLKLKAGDAK